MKDPPVFFLYKSGTYPMYLWRCDDLRTGLLVEAVFLSVLPCLLPHVVQGQADGIEPDTLDWHGYVPLALGNRWQYRMSTYGFSGAVTLAEWYEDRHIASDTVINDRAYYVLVTHCAPISSSELNPGCDPARVDRSFIRYDENTTSVLEYGTRYDGSVGEELWEGCAYRLGADFGASEDLFEWRGLEDNEPLILGPDVIETTRKSISVGGVVPFSCDFAHGIGLTDQQGGEGGGGWEERLIYARLEDGAFGTVVIPTSSDRMRTPPSFNTMIFPNPLLDEARLIVELPKPDDVIIIVYDMLGRQVMTSNLGYRPAGMHTFPIDGTTWSSGLYLVHVMDNKGTLGTTTVIKTR